MCVGAFRIAVSDPEAFNAYTSELFAPELVKSELANPDIAFYFAIDGEQPVGYTKLNFGKKQTIFQGNDAAEIERIYVLSDYQSQKIGKELLEHSIKTARARKYKKLWLAVWENNGKAIEFYKRHGFRKFLNHQYLVGNDPQNDLLMKISL